MGFNNDDRIYLSIIIPAYNISDIIQMTIKNFSKILNVIGRSYEIIVVNDGSTDQTLSVLQQTKKNYSNLDIISYEQNKGKGHAVRTGILRSRGDWVMYVDGDLDIVVDELLLKYLDELKNYDLLIASKEHPSSKLNIQFERRFLSKIFGIIVRLLTGLKIKDTQVGLKIGNGESMRYIFNIMSIDGFAFDVEFLVIASLLKMRIKEMPVQMNLRNRFIISYIARMFRDTFLVSYRYRIKHYYQKLINEKFNEKVNQLKFKNK